MRAKRPACYSLIIILHFTSFSHKSTSHRPPGPHNTLSIPNQHPLIPTRTRCPPLRSKKTPIHTSHKLRMRAHASQLPSLPTPNHPVTPHCLPTNANR